MRFPQTGELRAIVASKTTTFVNQYLPPAATAAAAASTEKASHAYNSMKCKIQRRWSSYNNQYHSLPDGGGPGNTWLNCSIKGSTWLQRIRLVFLLSIIAAFIFFVHRGSRMKDRRHSGYWNGIGTLVNHQDYSPEQAQNSSGKLPYHGKAWTQPPFEPFPVNPFHEYNSSEYLDTHHESVPCYLDESETVLAPDTYAYPGVPQHMTMNTMGSFEEVGLPTDICYERFGRLAPYGYGYSTQEGGLGLGDQSERAGSDRIFEMNGKIDYRGMDWGAAQKRCVKKNAHRFEVPAPGSKKKRVERHAFVLRAWTGYEWTPHQIMSVRAIVTELNLKSGGEYDIYILLHVKDSSIPIWTDKSVYRRVIQENIPKEFWDLTVLWSEQLMELFYPGSFPDNRDNDSGFSIHSVYRSSHFPIQWFSQERPDYDYYWNWEMDVRVIGHYYEFTNAVNNWSRKQPRKGLWERSAQYYIPEKHGSWLNFREHIENDIKRGTEAPIWGPPTFPNNGMLPSPPDCFPPRTYDEDNYEWGVGDDADLLTFSPMFDGTKAEWLYRFEFTGYSLDVPAPPARTAVVAIGRMSKRLLNIMHREVYKMHHTMFTEMFPPSVALHHGLKAAFVPHPLFFDRPLNADKLDQVFNHPVTPWDSVFSGREFNHLPGTFYYHAVFSGQLWRRWLGYRENGGGGSLAEVAGTGRMCLRTALLHPVKYEIGPLD